MYHLLQKEGITDVTQDCKNIIIYNVDIIQHN